LRRLGFFLDQRAILKSLISGGTWLFISNAIGALVGTIVFFFVARFITPAEYGLYAAIVGGVQFVMAALGGGLATWSTRHLSVSLEDSRWLLPLVLKWYAMLLAAIPPLVLIASLSFGLRVGLAIAASLVSIQVIVRAATDGVGSYLIATSRLGQIAQAYILEAILLGFLVTGLVASGFGVLGIAIGGLIATSGRAGLIWRHTRRRLVFQSGAGEIGVVGLLRQSAGLWMIQVIYALGGRLQPLSIGSQSLALAGLYVAGLKFVDSSQLIVSPLTPVLLPLLSRSRHNPSALRGMIAAAMLVMIGVAIGVGTLLIVFGDRTVRFLLGEQYVSLVPAMPMIALLVLITLVAQVASVSLIALNMDRFITGTVGIAALSLLIGLAVLAQLGEVWMLFGYSSLVSTITLSVWLVTIWRHTAELDDN
jgi:O-antigen/teichoic acid export membrane protein